MSRAHARDSSAQDLARLLCEMLYHDGADLTLLMVRAGILRPKEHGGHELDQKALRRYFFDHVVVCEGHWVRAYWPRGNRDQPRPVCTCINHALHAECEHQKFVSALKGGPPNLRHVPEVRPRGRKRKFNR